MNLVTDRLIREFLVAMADDEITVHELCRRLDRAESYVRKCLEVMRSLGIVERNQVPERGTYNRQKFVWKRMVKPKDD